VLGKSLKNFDSNVNLWGGGGNVILIIIVFFVRSVGQRVAVSIKADEITSD